MSIITEQFGKVVAMIGAAAILARRQDGANAAQAFGASPAIPEARPQSIPTLKMPTATGWARDQTPIAAPGLSVNAYARDLRHPRWLEVLPGGDVLVAEAREEKGMVRSAFDYAMYATMRRAAAVGDSANRVSRLIDVDGDGVAERRETFLEGQRQPFGMALVDGVFYVGNTDGIVAFDFPEGASKPTGPGRRLTTFQPGGHWTRSLIVSPDRGKLHCGVGSLTNIADKGMEAEEGRAAIHELDLATGESRIFASGLRNPVGLAWEPEQGALWTVVNERDGLGDETPPDYLTEVVDGGFYGWPYCYWDRVIDDRVAQDAALVATARTPDFALGGHTASLGLCYVPEGTLPGFGAGMAIGQHGSWNRSTLSGYRLIFVPFEGGRPSGPARDILTGFLSEDEKKAYGRPVGVALAPGGGLLLADDVGNAIWRVTGA